MDVTKLREINLYNDGDRTYYTQKLENCTIRKCWKECKIMSDYENQKKEVEEWNSKNKWKKRGIIMLPTKYGISFTSTMKNQGGALVHVSKPYKNWKVNPILNFVMTFWYIDLFRWISDHQPWRYWNGPRIAHQNNAGGKQSPWYSNWACTHHRNSNRQGMY